jgi:hypothetical protein
MGKNISRPKQVTDWVARLEKLEQTLAAESGSGLLVQPAWIEKNVLLDFCATNSLVRKIPACLCQIHRLLAADRGWGGASAQREAEGRRIPTEFLALSRWVLISTRDIASTCPFTDNAQGSQARLGPRLMPPQSQLLAYTVQRAQ